MFQGYVHQLHDPDPVRRIQALKVLAMLEETRALNAIHHVFKNDPDLTVRQVAKWAGSLIWQAQQRGYTTEKGMEAHFANQITEKQQEAMLDSLILQAGDNKNLQLQMDELQNQWQRLDTMVGDRRATQTQPAPVVAPDDNFDLLDAGLSEIDDLDAGLSDTFKR